MTASGPFAMGPTLAGSSARRTAPRANFTPVVPQGPGAAQRLGAGLSQTAAPALGVKREPNDLGSLAKGKGKGKTSDEDEGEVYSDPDEGVEILDMENVRMMDWMAPESLKKEKQTAKKVKKEEKAKVDLKGKGTSGLTWCTLTVLTPYRSCKARSNGSRGGRNRILQSQSRKCGPPQ